MARFDHSPHLPVLTAPETAIQASQLALIPLLFNILAWLFSIA
jgi:hypothetical protein